MNSPNSAIFVSNMFRSRKKDFSRSLKKILTKISKDQLIQKLALDEASSFFVSNRIEEIARAVFIDDREKYIESLLQIIQTMPNISQQSKEARSSTINDVNSSKTQTDLVNAILKKNQNEVISKSEIDALKNLGGIVINQSSVKIQPFDAVQPETYHIYAAVDVTSYSLKMKLIQTDMKTTKETMTMLVQKMNSLLIQYKAKAVTGNQIMKKRIEELEKSEDQLKEEIAKLKSTIENETIPELNNKINVLKTKFNDSDTLSKSKIVELQKENEKLKINFGFSKENNEKSVKKIQEIEKQITVKTEQIKEYQEINNKIKNEMTEKIKQNKILEIELKNLKKENTKLLEENEQVKKDNEKIHAELVLSEHHNEYMAIEHKQMKEQLPKEKDAHFKALTEIAELKTQIEYLNKELTAKSVIAHTFSIQNNELSTKLSAADHSLSFLIEKNETNQFDAKIRKSKLNRQAKKNDEIKQLLSDTEEKLEKCHIKSRSYKKEIKNLLSKLEESEKVILELQEKIKKYNNENVGYRVAFDQLKAQKSNLEYDKGDMFTKINILANKNNILEKRIQQVEENESPINTDFSQINIETKVQDNKELLINSTSYQELVCQNESLLKQKQIDIQDKKKLISMNTKLQQQINVLLQRISDLDQIISTLKSEKNDNECIKRQFNKLQNYTKQQKLIIETIQNISSDLKIDITTLPLTIKKLHQSKIFSETVLNTISEQNYEVALMKISDMNSDSVTMGRIRSVFKNMNDSEIISSLRQMYKINQTKNKICTKSNTVINKNCKKEKVVRFITEVENDSPNLKSLLSKTTLKA